MDQTPKTMTSAEMEALIRKHADDEILQEIEHFQGVHADTNEDDPTSGLDESFLGGFDALYERYDERGPEGQTWLKRGGMKRMRLILIEMGVYKPYKPYYVNNRKAKPDFHLNKQAYMWADIHPWNLLDDDETPTPKERG